MKQWMPLLLLVLLAGCDEPKQVTGVDFKREFDLRNAQTMVWSEYIGEKDGKVFLRRKTMSLVSKNKWNEEIWFTETNKLDSVFLDQLMKEKIPNQAAHDTARKLADPGR